MSEHDQLYAKATRALADERTRFAPQQAQAFADFTRSVFADGTLSATTEQIMEAIGVTALSAASPSS